MGEETGGDRVRIGVCILFEGRFAEGAAALVNSLYRVGFRGKVFAGYRGPWPPWMGPEDGSKPAPGLEIVPVPVSYERPLVWCKPRFLLDLWSGPAADEEILFYFDADIVVLKSWWFFESWVDEGVAACADVNADMPSGHPFRRAWREAFDPDHRLPCKQLDTYYNAGFFGLPSDQKLFLERWETFSEITARLRASDPWCSREREDHPFRKEDQDAFNAALMLGDEPLQGLGRAAMAFHPAGFRVMAHQIGLHKPWATSWAARSLRRRGLPLAARSFVENLDGPLRPYSRLGRLARELDVRIARAVGAVVGK